MRWARNNKGILIPRKEAGFIVCGSAFFSGSTSGPAGYAIWDAAKIPSNITRTSDTLLTDNVTNGNYNTGAANIGKSSGKWIFQTKCSNNDYFSGIAASNTNGVPWTNAYHLGNASTLGDSIGFENYNGEIWWNCGTNGTHGTTSSASGVAANAWLTVAVDLTGWTVSIFNGNTLLNSFSIPAQLQGKTYYPSASLLYSGNTCQLNAGQSTIAVPTPLAGLGYNPYWSA